MTNDDWTKEIRDRLAVMDGLAWGLIKADEHCGQDIIYAPADSDNDIITCNPNFGEFLQSAPTYMARLLEEREVMREALECICDHSWVRNSSISEKWINEFVEIAEKALAWKPKEMREK